MDLLPLIPHAGALPGIGVLLVRESAFIHNHKITPTSGPFQWKNLPPDADNFSVQGY